MRVGTLGKTLWNKSEVLLGTSWELGEPCKKQDANTLRTPKKKKIKNQKSKIALTLLKGTKNIGPPHHEPSHWLHELF